MDPCVRDIKPGHPQEHRHLVIRVAKPQAKPPAAAKNSPRPRSQSPRVGTLVFPAGERPSQLLMCRFWRMGKLCPFPGCIKCHDEDELLERESTWRTKMAAEAQAPAAAKTGGDSSWLARVQRERERETAGAAVAVAAEEEDPKPECDNDYEAAYACFAAGHEDGYLEGRAAGYAAGYAAGQAAGYAAGCAAGRRGAEAGELEEYMGMLAS